MAPRSTGAGSGADTGEPYWVVPGQPTGRRRDAGACSAYGRSIPDAQNASNMDESQAIAEAYRKAIAAADAASWKEVALLLARQPDRHAEAEAAFREMIAAGDAGAWNGVGAILARQRGRESEAESAYRLAIAAKNPEASCNLGVLLAAQGRDREAETA